MPAFISSTRQALRTMASDVKYSSGGRSIYPLPRTGLLNRVYLHVSGTMAVNSGTGSAALGPYGWYALLHRVKLIANQGTSIIDLSGYGAHLLDLISNGKDWDPELADDATTYGLNGMPSFRQNQILATGNVPVEFTLVLNVTPNDRDPIGAILLQTDQMAAELQFEWAAAGSAGNESAVKLTGNATAVFTGGVEITLETFTIPAGAAEKPDVSQVYQQLERHDGIGSTGPNGISLLRSDIYARIVHLVQVGGSPADDDVERLRLIYNGTDTPYQLSRRAQLGLQRRRYGRDLPPGVYVHDLMYQGVPGYGNQRDLVDARSVSEFVSMIDIDADAPINVTNSWIRTITQRFVAVQVPGGMAPVGAR